MVTDASPARLLVPDGVVPFRVDRAGLTGAVARWTRTRGLASTDAEFAPNALKQVTDVEAWRSAYLPYWVFHAKLAAEGPSGRVPTQ